MNVNCKKLPSSLADAVAEIREFKNFEICDDGITLESLPSDGPLKVECDGKNAKIYHAKTCDFFKGLAILVSKNGKKFDIEIAPRYDDLTVMLDCSRNKVITAAESKRLFRILTLMGYTGIQLYMEDTYEMKDYPYFGYMRGRYTAEELKEMDAYAAKFGFEVIGSIQTLGHLGSIQKWGKFSDLFDTGDILLVGEEKTYEFIEAMIKTMSDSLRTRKINLGMDEAEGIGGGRYRGLHGDVPKNKILMDHIGRVMEICKKYGYEPMMWADMIYYTAGIENFEQAKKKEKIELPEDVSFDESITPIYWTYYRNNPEEYRTMMGILAKLSKKPAFAGGSWKWSGTIPKNEHSLHVTKIALDCAEEAGIRTICNTIWGDDGDEGSVYSVLPAIAYYGARRFDSEDIDAILKTVTGISQKDFLVLDKANYVGGNPAPGQHFYSPWRYMLNGDPICGMYDKHIRTGYGDEFAEIAGEVEAAAKKAGHFKYVFKTIASLNRLLSYKAEMGILLKAAYDKGDKKRLEKLIETHVKPALKESKVYHKCMRKQWLDEAKGVGFEVIDMRLAMITARLETTLMRLTDYLDGKIDCIDELTEERLYVDDVPDENAKDIPVRFPNYASWKCTTTAGGIW